MAAPRKPPVLQLPLRVRDQLDAVSRRTQRSVAFLVHRALVAAGPAVPLAPPVPGEATATVPLTLDEDDPPTLVSKIRAAAGDRSLDGAVTAAWLATRSRFEAWADREEQAAQATRADDLDLALAQAGDPSTAAPRLAELARSEYPRVRALVAAHPGATTELLASLGRDRERVVLRAVIANPAAPEPLRAELRARGIG